MHKQDQTASLVFGSLGMVFGLIGLVMGIVALATVGTSTSPTVEHGSVPVIPCDITAGAHDWCQPYIDYGYANGAIMAQRILGENKYTHDDPSMTADSVAKMLYDDNVDAATHEAFPVRYLNQKSN